MSDTHKTDTAPQVIEISKNTDREFSFKKMALGWIAVVAAIVVLCVVVEIAVHGW